MRCLYCGKELALLKRWTGGGEFCSDGHRQRYQEEYNQLALNRLLQAKPPNEPLPVVKPAPNAPLVATEPAKQEAVREPNYGGTTVAAPPSQEFHVSESAQSTYKEVPPPPEPAYAVSEKHVEAAVLVEQPPPPPPAPEVKAPAEMAGFLVELPESALSEVASMSRPELALLAAAAASLPTHEFDPQQSQEGTFQLETAGMVSFHPSNQASDYNANGSRDRRLEVREFLRTPPIVEVGLSYAGATGLEISSEPMDFTLIAQPPQGSPPPWLAPPVEAPPGGTELGDLGRLAFATTGFPDEVADQEASNEPEKHSSSVAMADPEPVLAIDEPLNPEAEVPNDAPPEAVPSITEAAEAVAPEAEVAALPKDHAVVEVVHAEPIAESEPEPSAAPVEAPPIPEAVTTPVAVTGSPTAPGRGKTTQVYSSASAGVQIHIPRSTSLPLRPTMTFGPAPVKEAPAVKEIEKPVAQIAKNEPKKSNVAPAPVKTDPRVMTSTFRRPFADPKAAKPEAKPEPKPEPAKPEPAKLEATKPEVKAVANPEVKADKKAAPAPEPSKPKQAAKAEPKQDKRPPARAIDQPPAPLSPPYPGSTDLGLPHLSMESSPGIWARMPLFGKIAAAMLVLAGIGAVIYLSSKGAPAGPPSRSSGTIVAGSSLPVGDSGWITDWGGDPGVRRTTRISVLRASQTLTDYRIEMLAQIETKAIGWIFRAQDPKNYYVTKLEIVKPGLEPTVALVRFAVVNGEEQARAQLPLNLKVRRDTMFKIRFDAVGNHFTTYVQDEKVDDWTDDHIRTGGVGLYSERGENATLKGGMSVVPLVLRK